MKDYRKSWSSLLTLVLFWALGVCGLGFILKANWLLFLIGWNAL